MLLILVSSKINIIYLESLQFHTFLHFDFITVQEDSAEVRCQNKSQSNTHIKQESNVGIILGTEKQSKPWFCFTKYTLYYRYFM